MRPFSRLMMKRLLSETEHHPPSVIERHSSAFWEATSAISPSSMPDWSNLPRRLTERQLTCERLMLSKRLRRPSKRLPHEISGSSASGRKAAKESTLLMSSSSINRCELFFGEVVVDLVFGETGGARLGGLPAIRHLHVQAALKAHHAAGEAGLELVLKVLEL